MDCMFSSHSPISFASNCVAVGREQPWKGSTVPRKGQQAAVKAGHTCHQGVGKRKMPWPIERDGKEWGLNINFCF